jgi:hypothetical protein
MPPTTERLNNIKDKRILLSRLKLPTTTKYYLLCSFFPNNAKAVKMGHKPLRLVIATKHENPPLPPFSKGGMGTFSHLS